MNRKGGDREDSSGKQWEAKRVVKSLPSAHGEKPENLVKFTPHARIKRKHWISGDTGILLRYNNTNHGLLPTTLFDNARTMRIKSVISG